MMASSSSFSGLDLNDEPTLDVYSQLLLFKNDILRDEILWRNPETNLRKTIQLLAYKLDLEYEFSLGTQIVRISRPTVPDNLETGELGFIDFGYSGSQPEVPNGDFSVSDSYGVHSLSPDLPASFSQPSSCVNTPAAASDSSMMLSGLSNRPSFESNDFLDVLDPAGFPDGSQALLQASSTVDLAYSHNPSRQCGQPSGPASPAVWSTENSSRAQISPDYPSDFPSDDSELHRKSQQNLDLRSNYLYKFLSSREPTQTQRLNQGMNTQHDQSQAQDSMQQRESPFEPSLIPNAIVIKNIPFAVKKEQLIEIMRHKGLPLPCAFDYHFDNGVFRGLAFGHFATADETDQVIQALNHMDLNGRRLRVEYKKMLPAAEREPIEQEKRKRRRLEAETSYVNEAMPSESLAERVTRIMQEISTEATRPSPLKRTESNIPTRNASRRNSMANISDTWASSPKQPASRSGSVSSFQSDRSRYRFKTMFRRRSSAHSRASSGYQEIVFDSKSIDSRSRASSVASGRRGPLDGFAKVAMNAVKLVGACWRCKFLRKSCSPESPCNLCPRGNSRSNWEAVGCKRGELRAQMPPVKLCSPPAVLPVSSHWKLDPPHQASNHFWQQALERRERELGALGATCSFQDHVSSYPASQLLPLGLSLPLYSSIRAPESFPPALVPLNECILAIAWELNDRSSACDILEILGDTTPESLVLLLRSAARYQAKLERDQLIAQSLICLRSCLEVLHIREVLLFEPSLHQLCSTDLCKVECISSLELNLALYLDELSRVFFKKENLKSRNGYWLSAFYSFCVQAVVRRALLKIMDSGPLVNPACSAAKQFLHLAIKLFIAGCGTYDPLTTDYSVLDPAQAAGKEDLVSLQQVLGGPILSSTEYLKDMFEIDEEPVAANDFGIFSFKNLPTLKKSNAAVIQKLRDGAIAAQCKPNIANSSSSNSFASPTSTLERGHVLPTAIQHTRSNFKFSARPSNTSQIDAVESQEALGEIIVTLTDQQPISNVLFPAAPDAIAALPKKILDTNLLESERKGECAVCIDGVHLGDEVVILPCGHWFHEECTRAWPRAHNLCPICHRPIEAQHLKLGSPSEQLSPSPLVSGFVFPSPADTATRDQAMRSIIREQYAKIGGAGSKSYQ